MKSDALEFLNQTDWDLLLEKAQRVTFGKGDTILEGGTFRRAIFIIDNGLVRVEQSREGKGIALAQLGSGEIFGEMAFLEGRSASASIIAEDQVAAYVIEETYLQSLLASNPGFAVRFYQSLAVNLAHRLRKTSKRLTQLNVSEVAQVNRFHNPRTGNISARQIPPELVADIDAFEKALFAVEEGLRARRLSPEQAQAQVGAACDGMVALLERYTQSDSLVELGWDDLLAFRDTPQLEAGVGDHIFRATFPFVMLSATIARCYTKPRGFADDYETYEMIYRNDPEGDNRLGEYIDRWYLNRPLCQSRRNSRRMMADLLRQALTRFNGAGAMPVTNLASGTARELFDLYSENPSLKLQSTCIDVDNRALQFTNQMADNLKCNDRMAFVQANVVLLAEGQSDLSLLPQHLIYALGLCDYLKDEEVVSLLNWSWNHLHPGGAVILTNLDPANPDRPLMEHILEWKTHHRKEAQLRELFRASKFGEQPVEVKSEDAGVNLFTMCTKQA